MLEEKGLVGDGGFIGCHNISKTDGFDSPAHGVEPRKLLTPESFVDEGLHKELITLPEKVYVWKVFMNNERLPRTKLPEGFIPTIGNIGCKRLVGGGTQL